MKLTEKIGLVLATVLALALVVTGMMLLDMLWFGMGLYVGGLGLLVWVANKVDLRR